MNICECDMPDGPCDGCGEEHGHTCIVCDVEYCDECWDNWVHTSVCESTEGTT